MGTEIEQQGERALVVLKRIDRIEIRPRSPCKINVYIEPDAVEDVVKALRRAKKELKR